MTEEKAYELTVEERIELMRLQASIDVATAQIETIEIHLQMRKAARNQMQAQMRIAFNRIGQRLGINFDEWEVDLLTNTFRNLKGSG